MNMIAIVLFKGVFGVMNYIGNVIKEFRDRKQISRKMLSENVCTEKYVYLIEKGERTHQLRWLACLVRRWV